MDDTLFASGKCFKDLTICPGKATVTYDGEEKRKFKEAGRLKIQRRN